MSDDRRHSRRHDLLVYFAAWIPLALVYGIAVRMTGAGTLDALLSGVTTIGVAALLGLVVRRFQPRSDSSNRWRDVGRHLLLALAFSAIWTTIIAVQVRLGAPKEAYDQYIRSAVVWQFVSALILYGLLAAAFAAVETNRRLREQQVLAARSEALRVKAELSALRSQLNPHFLFNTLHSITALVRTDAAGAESALERLGSLFRRVLELNREAREEVALAEELDFVRDYLSLERTRLGARLVVREEIDPEALDCMVLAFTLQPLVENAIRHGVAPLGRTVTIRLAAELSGERLLLEVADDGPGCDARSIDARRGVGLSAVRQRLQARFGDTATMRITTAPGEGFHVSLDLPVMVAAPAPTSSYARV